eukprot:1062096-Amphidinium_carterae.1
MSLMTIEQLRELVQPQEELHERHQAGRGFYVGPPPIPQLDQTQTSTKQDSTCWRLSYRKNKIDLNIIDK